MRPIEHVSNAVALKEKTMLGSVIQFVRSQSNVGDSTPLSGPCLRP